VRKIFIFVLLVSLNLISQKGPDYVSEPSVPTISPPVKELPPSEQEKNPYALEMKRRDDWGFSGENKQGSPWNNPLLDIQSNAPAPNLLEQKAFSTPIINVNGYTSPSSPPDTTGDVGRNHFLQATNAGGYGSLVHIYTKNGTFVQTFAMEGLASSSPCNDGGGQYLEGSYLIGVNAGSTGKRDLYALDRKKMLQGQPATYQKFSVNTLSAFGFQLVLPAGHKGPYPPTSNSGAFFLRPVDTEIHSGFTCSP
jgi:hypothetical protein